MLGCKAFAGILYFYAAYSDAAGINTNYEVVYPVDDTIILRLTDVEDQYQKLRFINGPNWTDVTVDTKKYGPLNARSLLEKCEAAKKEYDEQASR